MSAKLRMTPKLLHEYLKRSLCDVVVSKYTGSLRVLLESVSTETSLNDLLFLTLYAAGHAISREFSVGGRRACDLVLHEPFLLQLCERISSAQGGLRREAPSSPLRKYEIEFGGPASLGPPYKIMRQTSSALILRRARSARLEG